MLTIISTPKPFRGHIDVIQRNALGSWKRLHPDIEVILFGDDEGAAEVCEELGLRHEPYVEKSKHGTKMVRSIFGRAQEMARHDVLSYVNCDIILTEEFSRALQQLQGWRDRFLMVGRRWDTDITEPLDFSRTDWQERVVVLAHAKGYQRFYHNVDYFVFRRGLYAEIPPLVIGRVGWDHWLVAKAHANGAVIVDASETVCAVHQNHDYGYHPKGIEGVWRDDEARENLKIAHAAGRERTIEDAEYQILESGIAAKRFVWVLPAKRIVRRISLALRITVRTRVWHPLLNATRSLRHSLGLKKSALPQALQNRKRKHWMDQ